LSGVRGVMIGSCVDVTTLLARAFAPGKASALLSFNEGRLQPRPIGIHEAPPFASSIGLFCR